MMTIPDKNNDIISRGKRWYALFMDIIYVERNIDEWTMPYLKTIYFDGNPIATMGRRDERKLVRIIQEEGWTEFSHYRSTTMDNATMLTLNVPYFSPPYDQIKNIIQKFVDE